MAGAQGYRTVAYFVNWAIYGRKYLPQDLPADKLTHILYAFANVRPESGEVYLTDSWADEQIHWEGDSWNDVGTNLYGCLKQLNILKKQNRSLKILLSIGGWTYSSNFAAPASTVAGRAKFAESAVSLIKNYGFDGIDIDWEYPKSSSEAQDFVNLLRTCREAMDAYSSTLSSRPHFELTVACPAGPSNYQIMDLRGMDAYIDFWNLMAYDFAGSWDQVTGHQANIKASQSNPKATAFSAETAVKYYIQQGVHPSKIVLGMPLYGRAFENTEGLGKPYSGVGQGSWEGGVYDYKALPLPGATEYYDEEAVATYSYDPAKKMLVTYDTVEMGRKKTEWIKNARLGGAMWWESSADKVGEGSLISAVAQSLGTLENSPNCLEYPETKFDNLKNGI
ncbi:hypothetical protein B7463_g7947, partial [Scytalidium lignicola]